MVGLAVGGAWVGCGSVGLLVGRGIGAMVGILVGWNGARIFVSTECENV